MRKEHQRADYVPAEPVRRALNKWLREAGSEERKAQSEFRAHGTGPSKSYSEAHEMLASKMDVQTSTVYAWATRPRYSNVSFDLADRILTAIDQVNLWWQDPELSQVYERACKGADRIYPIIVAEPEPLICTCEYCDETFEVWRQHGSPRRFCSHSCRQAAYKERKLKRAA